MKIRSRIAGGGVSTPLTRYVLATGRRRIIASWMSAALHPVRSGSADSAITARVQRREAASWPRTASSSCAAVSTRPCRRDMPHHQSSQQSLFYQHVSDKEDLVRSVLDDQAQALLSDQRRQLADVTTIAGLDTWRDNLVAANRQGGGALGCVLATMVSQLADHDETSRIPVAGYFAEWRRLVATTLRRMQAGGQLRRDADPDELATGLIAALQGGYVLAHASRNVDHMATAIEMALARIRFFADHR
jgi:TetR/AcrR family transcriptional repressor of nem operon